MTNAELIQAIRNEIERQMNFYDGKEREVLDDPKQFTYALLYQGHQRMCAKLLSFLSTLEGGSSEIPNDLEEAAKEWSKENTRGFVLKDKTTRYVGDTIDAFIAGAKWQAEKDKETIKLAEDHAFLAGADWQKDQMLKDAVEGYIVKDITGSLAVTAKGINLYGFKFGDNVKLIIVKE